MLNHTRALFLFVILACSGLFYGQNALAVPLTYEAIADCDVRPDTGQGGIAHSLNGTDINWLVPVGGVDITAEPCYTYNGAGFRDTLCTGVFAGVDKLYLDDDSFGICPSGVGCFLSSSIGGSALKGCATNLTIPTTPIITSTSTLDLVMPNILNTLIDFTKRLYIEYWPFVMAFAIVATASKVISKFFNLIAK